MPRELSPLQNDISPCCKLLGDVFGFAINPQSSILFDCLFTYFMMLCYVGNSSTNKTLIRCQRILDFSLPPKTTESNKNKIQETAEASISNL